MKKIFPLSLLTICLLTPLMSSCSQSSTPRLTYGSLIAQDEYGLGGQGGYKSSYIEIKERIKNKETMLVAVYPGEDSTCGCWTTFQRVIYRFIQNTNYKVYCVNTFDLWASNDTYGFEAFSDSPTFHIIHNENIIFKSTYKNDDQAIYKSENALKEVVNKYVKAPAMYEIGLNEIDDIANKEKSTIFFSRGTCADCNYVIPNTLIPYFNNHNTNDRLYVFDMDVLRNGDQTVYQQFKDEYGLSEKGNETYGYGLGYVPTFQHRENGEIKYASVYFNDTIIKDNEQYKVGTSYYTQNRINNLPYLVNAHVETKILEGLILDSEEVFEIDSYIIWSQEKAAKYHDPLLKAFLDYTFIN